MLVYFLILLQSISKKILFNRYEKRTNGYCCVEENGDSCYTFFKVIEVKVSEKRVGQNQITKTLLELKLQVNQLFFYQKTFCLKDKHLYINSQKQ